MFQHATCCLLLLFCSSCSYILQGRREKSLSGVKKWWKKDVLQRFASHSSKCEPHSTNKSCFSKLLSCSDSVILKEERGLQAILQILRILVRKYHWAKELDLFQNAMVCYVSGKTTVCCLSSNYGPNRPKQVQIAFFLIIFSNNSLC